MHDPVVMEEQRWGDWPLDRIPPYTPTCPVGGCRGIVMTHSVRPWRWALVTLLALVIAASVLPAAAQGENGVGFGWTRQFGAPGDVLLSSLAADAFGIYVGGYAIGALPDQTSYGGVDAFLRKYDAHGNEVWTCQFGTPVHEWVYGIAVDASGVYVVGPTQAGGVPNEMDVILFDVFLRKYDVDGKELWTRQFGTPEDDIAYAIAADGTAVYVSGMTTGMLPNQTHLGGGDAFVRKYDVDGNELWTRQFGTPGSEWGFGIAANASGVYVVGEVRGPNETGVWESDAYVRKYTSGGDYEWTRRFGAPDLGRGVLDMALDAAADASGVYVVGFVNGALQNETGAGYEDAFLRKYDPAGNHVWTRQFGTYALDVANAVAIDGSEIFVAGQTTGPLSGPKGADGSADSYLRSYDADGNERWTIQFGSRWADAANGVDVSPLGLYVAGDIYGSLLNRSTAGTSAEGYLARVGEAPEAPASLRAVPGAGEVSLTWDSPAFDGRLPVEYRVYRGTDPDALEPIALVDGTVREYVDLDVAVDVTYHYRVAAVNGIGEGPWSAPATATPRARPVLLITTPAEVVTGSPHVVIEGLTEPNATVTVNGAEVPVAPTGAFRWSAMLPDGRYEFQIVARNTYGLTSSAIVVVTVDTKTPVIVLLTALATAVGVGAFLFAAYRRRRGRRRAP